jgi:hypothetical protein
MSEAEAKAALAWAEALEGLRIAIRSKHTKAVVDQTLVPVS